MKRENRIKSILLSLILALLLPVMATASGSNTLTIYKVVNASGTHLLHEKPSGASTPIPGAIYRIWRVGEVDRSTDQAGYDAWLAQLKALSISELDEAYPEPVEKRSFPTDTNGKTVFSNLPDGRYYVREVEEIAGALASVNTSVPFLMDLPYLLDGELLSEISVHPKGTKPDVPDEPDEPEKPPEGGEKFIKVDDKGVGLEGARFKLMLRVKNEEGKAKVDASGAYIYEPVLRDGKE
ncbi:MAG: SpaA isopeptide-forming pilin-related protein, partial [Tissierellia bacterium]|nr:SpaA isopeptide-forming pilin-related protein [Tissierellia bacterium]